MLKILFLTYGASRDRDEAKRNRGAWRTYGASRDRCLKTWRGVFEPSMKVCKVDEAERNRGAWYSK